MNPAPLPQPAAQTCPNCGAGVERGVAFCPRCGASLTRAQTGGCLIIAAQAVLVILALIFGLAGACFVLLGSGIGADWMPWLGGGALALALAAACIWGVRRLGKRLK